MIKIGYNKSDIKGLATYLYDLTEKYVTNYKKDIVYDIVNIIENAFSGEDIELLMFFRRNGVSTCDYNDKEKVQQYIDGFGSQTNYVLYLNINGDNIITEDFTYLVKNGEVYISESFSRDYKMFDLVPQYSNAQSFYGKAKVIEYNDGTLELLSYNTPVARITNDGMEYERLESINSSTTTRHIKEFIAQFYYGNEIRNVNKR